MPTDTPAAVRYRLRMPEPHTHLLHVEMELDGVDGPTELVMPSWTPGSYLMREFPRNVMALMAADGAGRMLPAEKTDKNTWRVDAPADGRLAVRYVVHADELSVRTSHLDASHATVNGASVFLFARGREHAPHRVAVDLPNGWRATTSMAEESPNAFVAADYDELVDAPLELGTHALWEWEIDGTKHRWAVWGRGNYDPQRLAVDATAIVRAEKAMFGVLPYGHFTFILHLTPGGSGGLEHKASTILQADRWSFRGVAYEHFLALTAHELFHAWNGKRIRPAVLGPFDYTREAYTRDLWVVEGITTYYTDLVLRRAGLISPQRYLERLAETVTRHFGVPGRFVQPLADSSFDTWIKFYRPDANSPNATISYYQKGALVALLLDLKIRQSTAGARSLDDVMRVMWDRFGAPDVGFPPGEVERVAAEVAGEDLTAFFDATLRGRGELDYAPYLAAAGLELVGAHTPAANAASTASAAAASQAAAGSEVGESTSGGGGLARQPGSMASASTSATASATDAASGGVPADSLAATPTVKRPPTDVRIGVQMKFENGKTIVGNVLADSPAWRAGLNAGDEVIALDGLRVGLETLSARLMDRKPGERVVLTVFRRDELVNLALEVEAGPPQRWEIRPTPQPTPEQTALRDDWLRAVVTASAPAAG
ncbi:MAG: peptidase domain protein [Gemmatimonadetes bacterium]|nr:peptidase domain protein [Gemmatimonadota bacterium]